MGKYDSNIEPEEHAAEFEKLSKEEQNAAILNPGHVDEGLWDKAKKMSQKSYGEIRWPFVHWMYKQLGGK